MSKDGGIKERMEGGKVMKSRDEEKFRREDEEEQMQ